LDKVLLYCTNPQGVIGISNPNLPAIGGTVNNANRNGATVDTAICRLRAVTGGPFDGLVIFSQTGGTGNVVVTANVTGLGAGTLHGFHVHEFGDLTSQTGTPPSHGGHYNPLMNTHGIPGIENLTPAGVRHVGDMGNIFFFMGGEAFYQFSNNLITLNGANNIIGRAVIVHQLEDMCTQPAGDAGSRYASCVIGITDSSRMHSNLPSNLPVTQDTMNCEVVPSIETSSESAASVLKTPFGLLFG